MTTNDQKRLDAIREFYDSRIADAEEEYNPDDDEVFTTGDVGRLLSAIDDANRRADEAAAKERERCIQIARDWQEAWNKECGGDTKPGLVALLIAHDIDAIARGAEGRTEADRGDAEGE